MVNIVTYVSSQVEIAMICEVDYGRSGGFSCVVNDEFVVVGQLVHYCSGQFTGVVFFSVRTDVSQFNSAFWSFRCRPHTLEKKT